MRTEYRILFTMTFDNSTERDSAYAKLKTAITTSKTTITYRQAHMTKDEYNVPEPSTEAI